MVVEGDPEVVSLLRGFSRSILSPHVPFPVFDEGFEKGFLLLVSHGRPSPGPPSRCRWVPPLWRHAYWLMRVGLGAGVVWWQRGVELKIPRDFAPRGKTADSGIGERKLDQSAQRAENFRSM
ncbi:hypothetical protein BDZ91DRAFT_718785 [Kalaharituber pfeilii]|nr:hypothetical protein BDZ91DRAFT_718785 [Kalaharituber pfeilii]